MIEMDKNDLDIIQEWEDNLDKNSQILSGLKFPVNFKFDGELKPEMDIEFTEPEEKQIHVTQPKIIRKTKNKGGLF